jgi:hypothetical protein
MSSNLSIQLGFCFGIGEEAKESEKNASDVSYLRLLNQKLLNQTSHPSPSLGLFAEFGLSATRQ